MSMHYNIDELLASRGEQLSFHVASEAHVRVEFRNCVSGDTIGPFSFEGDLIITCFGGTFLLSLNEFDDVVGRLDQVVVPQGTAVSVVCRDRGAIQLVWAPPHASTTSLHIPE